MRRDKSTFILSAEYESFTDGMSDEEAGILFKAILRHENGGDVGELPAEVRAVWSFIKNRLDTNKAAYEEACKAHAEARTNGDKKEQKEQKVTKSTKSTKGNKRVLDNENDNDHENENENDHENDKDSKPKRTQAALVGESDLSEPVKDKLMEWLAYKKERKDSYGERGLQSLISQVHRHEQESGSSAVINVIDLSMSNQWKGIIWEKIEPTARSGTTQSSEVMGWLTA
jgi:hypothetical protein